MSGKTERGQSRRKVLGATAGLVTIGSIPIVSADHGNCAGYGGDHLRDGSQFDCYFSYATEYNSIYNDVNQWENSMVTLSHPDWADNIRIRFGTVSRAGNTWIKNQWSYYVENKNGSSELGTNRQLMLAGSWSSSDHNLWNWEHHCGRLNDWRCVGSDAAVKYFYHELGHAHLLGHRDDPGEELMDSSDWYGMEMTNGEADHWYNIYSSQQGTCDGSSHNHQSASMSGGPGQVGGHEHDHISKGRSFIAENNGIENMTQEEIDKRRRNHEPITRPKAVKIESLK